MSYFLSAESKLKIEESRGVCCIEKRKAARVAVELTRFVKDGHIDCGWLCICFILAHIKTGFIGVDFIFLSNFVKSSYFSFTYFDT
jgi:hypothetical protein